MLSVRRAIQAQIHDMVGFGSGTVDLDRPHGDAGLFGPGSAAWRVHGDFTAMLIGGTTALLVQMLHPLALAGVWDHSDFRRDMAGRLRRTAQFISGTTYGGTATAEALITRVRAIHERVTGTLPDGTPYSANDPALLTWVHVAEVSSFLAAYLRYRGPLGEADQDRYYAEVATIAERLGATGVPTSRRAVAAYFEAMRPALRCDERTRAVARALLDQPAPGLLAAPARAALMAAAIRLLPPWAAALHGLSQRQPLAAGAHGIGSVLRWALRDGSRVRAERRVG